MILTRCPHCGTTFRATPEQLKVRHGCVRCGQCQTVFDGLESLVEVPETPPPEAPAEVPPQAPPPEALPADETPPPEREEEPVEAAPEPAREAPAAPVGREKPPRRRWPWLLGIFLLALPALFLQALVHFRVDIAVLHPGTKPALRALCRLLACDLPLPRRIDLVSIENSDLHPAGPANDGRLRLSANLRNRASFAQAWPYLELTLTDSDDRPLARKAFAPAEYLPPDVSHSGGFPAGAEQSVALTLEAPDVPAAGYRLYTFHP